jgi:hypothetical protein
MNRQDAEAALLELKELGFDESSIRQEDGQSDCSVHVRCSQCAALFINGMACHETGCPNQRRKNGDLND